MEVIFGYQCSIVKELIIKTAFCLFLCLYHRTHHVHDADVSVGEYDGVGRVGHWKQEGEGCAQGGGDQDVQRVDVDSLRLKKDGSHKQKSLS